MRESSIRIRRSVCRVLLAMAAMAMIACLAACESVSVSDNPSSTWAPLPTIGSGDVMTATATLTGTLESATMAAPVTLAPTDGAVAPAATASLPPTEALPTEALPTAVPPTVAPESGPTQDDILSRAAWARDQAWEFLASGEGGADLPQQPAWEERAIEGEQDGLTYRFEYEGWIAVVALSGDTASTDRYQIDIGGPSEQTWTLTVGQDGAVSIDSSLVNVTPAAMLRDLDGETGNLIVSDDEDAALLFRPVADPDARYAIVPADVAVTATLRAAREAGAQIQVWGTVEQAADDANPYLFLERFTIIKPSPTPIPRRDSELVEGWTGRIISAPGTPGDDYFAGVEPAGDHGIEAMLSRDQELLVELSGTGELVRVWGVLDYGVEDHNQRRIVVSRLERLGS